MLDYSKDIFPLSHLVLYSKGWYAPINKDEDKFTFLRKVAKLDDYDFIQTKQQLLYLLLTHIDNYDEWSSKQPNGKVFRFTLFMSEAEQYVRLYDMDIVDAQIRATLDFLMRLGGKEIVLKRPVFNRKLFKKGIKYGNSVNGLTYKHINEFVSSFDFKD